MDLNSEFIPPVAGTSVVPFPCSYQLWPDEKHLGEYRARTISGLPPLFQHLLGVGLALPAERLKDPKDVVASRHHFSTVCAENPLLVITVMLL